jgi:hypothetical protein
LISHRICLWTRFSRIQQTAAIRAALELDVFREIARGNATAESLAQTTGSAVRGIRILCDYLTVAGIPKTRVTSSD